MALVRDDREAQLRDLIVATQEAADAYDDALELIEGEAPAFADALRPHLLSCLDATKRLEDCARALGDLPPSADRDLETFRSLGLHIETALSNHHRAVITDTLLERERAVAEACTALAALELPEELATAVDACADRTELAIAALEEKSDEAD